MNRRSHLVPVLAAVVLASLVACGDKEKSGPVGPPRVAPDFSLVDANPNSASTGRTVSPRQERNNVSAWYFGHAN